MIDVSTYPKSLTLRGETEVSVQIMHPRLEDKLRQFMGSIPATERVHFRDDVSDPEVIHQWSNDINLERVIPLLAINTDDDIVANWTLHHREHGWIRHHGHIRGIVTPKWRNKGLATLMVRELLRIAGSMEIERVVIELVEPQMQLLERYRKIGFKIDAVLKDWVKDFSGRYNDIHVLSTQLEPAWQKMDVKLFWPSFEKEISLANWPSWMEKPDLPM